MLRIQEHISVIPKQVSKEAAILVREEGKRSKSELTAHGQQLLKMPLFLTCSYLDFYCV